MRIIDHQEFEVAGRSFSIVVYDDGNWLVYENRFNDEVSP